MNNINSNENIFNLLTIIVSLLKKRQGVIITSKSG